MKPVMLIAAFALLGLTPAARAQAPNDHSAQLREGVAYSRGHSAGGHRLAYHQRGGRRAVSATAGTDDSSDALNQKEIANFRP